MFEFLKERLKKQNDLLINFSQEFTNFLNYYKEIKIVNKVLNESFKSDYICYIDISTKSGMIKTLPVSKYFYILKKYKNIYNYDINEYKDNFINFYNTYKILINIDKDFQYTKIGKVLNKIIISNQYDIETFVLKYKKYQKQFII
jgi:hypothetical protein